MRIVQFQQDPNGVVEGPEGAPAPVRLLRLSGTRGLRPLQASGQVPERSSGVDL